VTKTSAENVKSVSAIGTAGLSLAALGVVFGDIGTSPLYTLKTVLNLTGANPDASTTLGALSLILWTLFIVTTVKYVNFAMRIDNDGEGGIIALLFIPGYEASAWYGIGAPRGTSTEIIDRLNSAINACLADLTLKTRLAEVGGIPFLSSPTDFGHFIAAETEKWAKVIKSAGIKQE
jgi:hypothetical protein